MEAMMRTLLTTFSFAALCSLATACAVEDPSTLESLDVTSDIDWTVNDEEVLPPQRAGADRRRSLDNVDAHAEELASQPWYCELDYDCESGTCNQELNVCSDDPLE